MPGGNWLDWSESGGLPKLRGDPVGYAYKGEVTDTSHYSLVMALDPTIVAGFPSAIADVGFAGDPD